MAPPVVPPEPPPRHPFVWAVLYFPFGLTFGFPSIALGYLASRARVAGSSEGPALGTTLALLGLDSNRDAVSVSTIAGVICMTWLASGWKFTWAPLGDYTLSRKKWYRIAISLVSVGFIAMSLVPLRPATMPLLSGIVLLTSIAGTFIAFATEGLMTHNSPPGQHD